jgi:phage replication protein O, N-terminal domain
MNSNSVRSPQLENGYTMIAHELLEVMARYPFNGGELKTLLVIIRDSYGYKRKVVNISLTELSKRTDLSRRHIVNILKRLKSSSVIFIARFGNKNVMGLNKSYTTWKLWISPAPKREISPE